MTGVEIIAGESMTALLVVAHLGDAIVSFDDALPLDAMVSHGYWVLMAPDERDALPKIDFEPMPRDFVLPLARWSVGDGELDWGWVCTHAMGEWQRGVTEVRRRYPYGPLREMTDIGRVTPGAGPDKAIDKSVPVVLARSLRWYCIGHRSLVRRYLRVIPALGKVRGHGHGTVLRWEVVQAPDDVTAEWIMERRRLPARARGGSVREMAIRPPYWHRGRYTPSVDPDAALLRVAG